MPATNIGARRIDQWLESLRQRLLWQLRCANVLHSLAAGLLLLAIALWWPTARQHFAVVAATAGLLCLSWLLVARWRERSWTLPAVAAWADEKANCQQGLLTFVALRQAGQAAPRLLPALVARILVSVARHDPAKLAPVQWGRPASFLAASAVLATLSWWLAPPPAGSGSASRQEVAIQQLAQKQSAAAGQTGSPPQRSADLIGGTGDTEGEDAASSSKGGTGNGNGSLGAHPRAHGPGGGRADQAGKGGAGQEKSVASSQHRAGEPRGEGEPEPASQSSAAARETGLPGKGESSRDKLARAPQAGPRGVEPEARMARSSADSNALPCGSSDRNRRPEGAPAGPKPESQLPSGGSSRAGKGVAAGGLFGERGDTGTGHEGREAQEKVAVTLLGLSYVTASRPGGAPAQRTKEFPATNDSVEPGSAGAPIWKLEVPEPYREALRRMNARGGGR